MSKATNVRERKSELENQLKTLLETAMTSKDSIDKLAAHYRISNLYRYSFYNQIMIAIQGGTICQSYKNWQKLGRQVQKGQKANIDVFVPFFKKELVNGKERDVLKGFFLKRVFDISQTEGDELQYDHNSEENSMVDYNKVSNVLSDLTGAPIKEKFTDNARGYSNGSELVVSNMSNDTDKIKTLIHEAAHHILHTSKTVKDGRVNKETAEVEAEAVSHLVNSYLGLDYTLSVAYINAWRNGISNVRCDKVIKLADKIIKALEK